MAKTSSIRDKYKATPIDVIKSSTSEEDKMVGGYAKRDGYLDIKDGTNKFRIFPKKEDDKTYWHVVCKHWHTILDDDDNEKRITVYNARIHGGLKHDVNEEYIKAAQIKIAAEKGDADESAKKLKALTDWKGGIGAQTAWVVYANKVERVGAENKKDFGLLELKKTMRDDLNSESMTEDPDDEITVDPYTDPDTGKAFLITKEKKKQGKTEKTVYSVKISKEMPLDDEELEMFDEKRSLTELFTNIYSEYDFDNAVAGLKWFDDKNEIGLFEDDEWLQKVKDLKKDVKNVGKAAEDDEEEEEKPPVKTSSKSTSKPKAAAKPKVEEPEDEEEEEEAEEEAEQEDEEEDGDQFVAMDRNELKKFIKSEGLEVKVLTKDTDEDLRNKIRAAMPAVEEEAEEEEEEEAEEVVEDKSKSKLSLKDIKDRIKNQVKR